MLSGTVNKAEGYGFVSDVLIPIGVVLVAALILLVIILIMRRYVRYYLM